MRDSDGKKYIFMVDEAESWKLSVGLQRLRKGSQARTTQYAQMPPSEMTRILNTVPPFM